MEIVTIRKNEDSFPKAFRAIGRECPETIYAMGNLELLREEGMVAIIGARMASRVGNGAAYALGAKLAKEGKVIVSRLALGCS